MHQRGYRKEGVLISGSRNISDTAQYTQDVAFAIKIWVPVD